jgi:hypothetical protein
VTNKVVKDNLSVEGSLISKPVERDGVWYNPTVFEVQYDVQLNLK